MGHFAMESSPHAVCLRSARCPAPSDAVPSEFPGLSGVLLEYLDLKEVFNKAQATMLVTEFSVT